MHDPLVLLGSFDRRSQRLGHLPPERPGPLVWLGAGLSAALLAAALVALWLAMRTVMDVGGACASGGPYVVETACPEGSVPVLAAAIPLGMLAGAAFALFGWRLGRGVPALAALAWPALFLSLGWNFLDYGVISPRDGAGVDPGWLICGVVFVLMGAPVLLALPRIVRSIEERRALVLAWVALAAALGGAGGALLVEAIG